MRRVRLDELCQTKNRQARRVRLAAAGREPASAAAASILSSISCEVLSSKIGLPDWVPL